MNVVKTTPGNHHLSSVYIESGNTAFAFIYWAGNLVPRKALWLKSAKHSFLLVCNINRKTLLIIKSFLIAKKLFRFPAGQKGFILTQRALLAGGFPETPFLAQTPY